MQSTRTYPIPLTSHWWQKVTYPRHGHPLTETGVSLERGFPWREGRVRVFRFPFTRHALVLGKWTGEQSHEDEDGIPTLTLRPLDNPEDYFHAVLDDKQPPAF